MVNGQCSAIVHLLFVACGSSLSTLDPLLPLSTLSPFQLLVNSSTAQLINSLTYLCALMNSTLWYPYAQMKHVKNLPKMVKANGVMMQLEDGSQLIDGISSWWAVIHGYNHPALNAALTQQLSQFAHVMLGGVTHQPALDLAATLVRITPE